MDLPVTAPVSPMLAKAAAALPTGEGWLYEPKWDGFRCIVFRDGPDVELGSRNERPFNRYFPEVVEAVRAALPERCVLDGELVVPAAGERAGLDFDALQHRIHPAESRVRRLAAQTPAHFIAFDLLALADRDLRPAPLAERRRLLEGILTGTGLHGVHLTPASTDAAVAADWFAAFEGAGLDGVVAKRLDAPYREGERVMVKVKHHRSADCVVAGFRWHKDGQGVGSLLLGLYDDAGVLHHVGVAASFTALRRRDLVEELAPLREDALAAHPWRDWAMAGITAAGAGAGVTAAGAGVTAAGAGVTAAGAGAGRPAGGRMPGAVSRWNATKDLSWEPVRPERVCEVEFDQLQGGRFRRVAAFLRWRPDRAPAQCRYDQLDVATPLELAEVWSRR